MAADTILVVWEETVYGRPEIYYAYKMGDGGWSAPARVEPGTDPALSVGPDGSIDLVWLEDNSLVGSPGTSFIRYRRWNDTHRMWLEAANIAVGSYGTLHSPAVAVDNAGGSHVVWGDSAGGWLKFRHRRREASGWGARENIPSAGGTNPAVDVGLDGRLHLVWSGASLLGNRHDVFYRWWDPEDGWSLSRVLSDRPGADAVDPTMIVDQGGTVHVGWRDVVEDTVIVSYRVGRETSWPAATESVVTSMGVAGAPAIAADGDRVYLAFSGADGIALYQRDAAAGQWEVGQSLVADQPASTSPSLAAIAEPVAYAAWAAPGVGAEQDVFVRASTTEFDATPSPSATMTAVASTTPTITLTPQATRTATWTPTVTLTPTRTATQTPTVSLTPSPTPTRTPTPTATPVQHWRYYLPLALRGFTFTGPDSETAALSRYNRRMTTVVGDTESFVFDCSLPLCRAWSKMW